MTPSSPVADHEECLVVIAGLRHNLLRATDRAIGAEAELERLRPLAAKQQADLSRELARARALIAERDRMRKQIAAIHASTTWRVGRALVLPVARVSRRRGRH